MCRCDLFPSQSQLITTAMFASAAGNEQVNTKPESKYKRRRATFQIATLAYERRAARQRGTKRQSPLVRAWDMSAYIKQDNKMMLQTTDG